MEVKEKSKKRELIKTIAIVFLAVLLVLTFFSGTIMNYSLPEVATQMVSSGTINAKIRGSGTLTANESYEVNLKQTREVRSVCVKVGDTVEEGTLLFVLGDVESEELRTAQEALDAAEQRIFAIRQGRGGQGLEHISTILLGVYDRLNELAASDSAVPGLSTGITDLDNAIAGLNKSDLILLAARPGMGKSSMALNMLLHAGKFSGKSVVYFSLEMSREQLAMRLISNESFVDLKKLITGKLNEDDWGKIAAASAALNQTNILIDDNPMLSVADMNAKCRRVDNLGLVVIDYLQLMTSAGGPGRGGDNRQQVVSDMSRALKIMAKELDVPVLCLSQLSRANESRADKRPMLSDLRESGAIEQDADIVMFLYRDDYYNDDSETHNLAECIIAKNRHGETRTVELQWLPDFTTFSDVEWKREAP